MKVGQVILILSIVLALVIQAFDANTLDLRARSSSDSLYWTTATDDHHELLFRGPDPSPVEFQSKAARRRQRLKNRKKKHQKPPLNFVADDDDHDDDDGNLQKKDSYAKVFFNSNEQDSYNSPKAPAIQYQSPSSSYEAESNSYQSPGSSYGSPPSSSYGSPAAPSYHSSSSSNGLQDFINALLFFLPIGLFLAAIPPNLITIAARKKRSVGLNETGHLNTDILNALPNMEFNDPDSQLRTWADCLLKLLCCSIHRPNSKRDLAQMPTAEDGSLLQKWIQTLEEPGFCDNLHCAAT